MRTIASPPAFINSE